jgi:hypothetical protein
MLAHALASHPELEFHCELRDFTRYGRDFRRVHGKQNFVIVMYNQLRLADRFGIDLTRTPVIHLTRNDRQVALSNVRNNRAKKLRGSLHTPHYTSEAEIPDELIYDPPEAEIVPWLAQIENWRTAALSRIIHNRRVLTIDYGDITGGTDIRAIPPHLTERLCTFLGVRVAPLAVSLIKSSR